MTRQALLAVLVISLLTTGLAAQETVFSEQLPDLIPRSILFGNPDRAMVQLSPDGKMISYLASTNGVLNVWVKTIGEQDDRQVTFDEDRGIIFYGWSANSKRILYIQDQQGNENWHLYSVHLRNGKVKDYTPFEGVQVRVTAWDPDFPNELLITMNRRNPQLHDVYHLNLRNGKLNLIAENPGTIVSWVEDEEFELRGALAINPMGGTYLLVRGSEDSPWDTLVAWDFENQNTSYPLYFSQDGNYMYMYDSRDANARRLVKMEIASCEFEVLAEDPTYDITGIMIHPETEELLWYNVLRDRRERIILADEYQKHFDFLYSQADGEVGISDYNLDFDRWLVSVERDNGPVSFYTYDLATKQLDYLFDHRPELNDYTMTHMEPISFISRDSLTIHGYITFPAGVECENLPMILNVHGGPWVRDHWGYNPEAQWLANRGYICLQVNYRGSSGYGKDFINISNKEWGRAMHYDLVDAVNWAVERGYADPDRIAIYGGSYGGYAALVGATFTPDLFCCAVDMFGPSNLLTFLNTIPPYWRPMQESMFKRVGHPVEDSAMLWERSPLSRVDDIRIPMLIVQGANDPRVVQTESDQIVAAMEERGIDYQYMVFEDEGHGFLQEENRLEFFAACERFLAEHLGGRFEE